MTLDKFQERVQIFIWSEKLHQSVTDPVQVTMSMPFRDYNELMETCLNSMNVLEAAKGKSMVIRHFRVYGVMVNLVEGDEVNMKVGGPGDDQKYFESFTFEKSS